MALPTHHWFCTCSSGKEKMPWKRLQETVFNKYASSKSLLTMNVMNTGISVYQNTYLLLQKVLGRGLPWHLWRFPSRFSSRWAEENLSTSGLALYSSSAVLCWSEAVESLHGGLQAFWGELDLKKKIVFEPRMKTEWKTEWKHSEHWKEDSSNCHAGLFVARTTQSSWKDWEI